MDIELSKRVSNMVAEVYNYALLEEKSKDELLKCKAIIWCLSKLELIDYIAFKLTDDYINSELEKL